MLNIIGAIVSGLVIGVLARFFYPGTVPMGWIATILLGVAGSLVAGLVQPWAAGLQPRRLPRLHHRRGRADLHRSEEHTSELQSLMRLSYAVFCLKKKNINNN